jgi:dihydroorotase (multifunctional complex type)
LEDLAVKNGLVIAPSGLIRGGLAIRNSKILQVGADDILPKARLEIDAEGAYVLPGLIDPHVHIGAADEDEYTSQFRSESIGAAVSGITTFMDFPRHGDILNRRLSVYQRGKEIGGNNSFVDFRFHAFLFTEVHLAEIPDLIKEGITSLKVLFGFGEEEAKRSGVKAVDLGFTYRAMEILASYSPLVLAQVHCEQSGIISAVTKRLMAQERNDLSAWAESRPGICEAIDAFAVGLISGKTGCPLYIVHVSAKETVQVIRDLKQMGVKVYAETCPQYLTLTTETPLGISAKTYPPLRHEEDTECLWQAVSDGTIDTIGSDHAVKHRIDRGETDIWQLSPASRQLGATLPLLMTEGVHKGRITMEQFVKLTSENVAKIWGIYPRKGVLSPGSDADIVIMDPDLEWTLSTENLKTASDFSMYEGRKVRGRSIKTFVRGRLVAEDGQLVAEAPVGKYVYAS